MTYDDIKTMLDMVPNPVEKLEMVMDFGKTLAPVPSDAVCSEITGCASFVQICRRGNNFFGTADSALVRGVVAIILSMVDGVSVDDIKKMDLDKMFSELKINLGAGRLNGVNSMIRFLKNL
ncbi:MAG: SufE family protein [Alphaproteobacteria bacterium]|nr:SufE family protein [Alphaproteobacteria bacterium]